MDESSLKIPLIKQKLKSLKSSFIIQAGHPSVLSLPQQSYSSIHEVFPHLFSEDDERMVLLWNKIPILFSYRFACYKNINQLMEWWHLLANHTPGKFDFTLETEDFFNTIHSYWQEDILFIESDWQEKRSHESLAKLLNQKGMIRINRFSFLKEWKILMYQITNAFKKTGVRLTDPQENQKLLALYTLINQVEGQGVRYTL